MEKLHHKWAAADLWRNTSFCWIKRHSQYVFSACLCVTWDLNSETQFYTNESGNEVVFHMNWTPAVTNEVARLAYFKKK